MIPESLAESLYFSRNSSAPEKAIWLMYFSTSSAVIPNPWSIRCIFLPSLSILTSMIGLPYSTLASPILAKCFNFKVASVALDTNSRKKISWSLYKNFLISGKMFSTDTLIFPVVIFLFIFLFNK